MRVGVISDTHGLLRPQVLCELKRCACIVHAGDFDREDVLRELEVIAPVYAVRGNNDWWGRDLPRTLSFELEGVRFTMAHNRNDVSWRLEGVQVVIFGHSHQYCEEQLGGRLWLNPGSCGYPRFRKELTMAALELEDGRFRVERITIVS